MRSTNDKEISLEELGIADYQFTQANAWDASMRILERQLPEHDYDTVLALYTRVEQGDPGLNVLRLDRPFSNVYRFRKHFHVPGVHDRDNKSPGVRFLFGIDHEIKRVYMVKAVKRSGTTYDPRKLKKIQKAIAKCERHWRKKHSEQDSPDEIVSAAPTVVMGKRTRSNKPVVAIPGKGKGEPVRYIPASNFQQWMIQLKPEQEEYTTADFSTESGERRIRGTAGTGKTVIGLHRFHNLCKRYPDKPMLFTAVGDTITEECKRKFMMLSQGECPKAEFIPYLRLARDTAEYEPGADDPDIIADVSLEAWSNTRNKSEFLTSMEEERAIDIAKYESEIIIHGLRIRNRQEYLELPANHSKQKLDEATRSTIWTFKTKREGMLKDAGVMTTGMTITAAEKAAHRKGIRYRCIVADEAQDMTASAIALLRTLVAGDMESAVPDNGLFLMHDITQRIYHNGFNLKRAGVNVTGGRSIRLFENYRTSGPIYNAAIAVRNEAIAEDIDEDGNPDTSIRETKTSIDKRIAPVIALGAGLQDKITAETATTEAIYITQIVKNLISQKPYLPGEKPLHGIRPKEVGIISEKPTLLRRIAKALKAKGIEYHYIERDRKIETVRRNIEADSVKLTSIEDVKGFEFRAVILPGMSGREFPLKMNAEDGDSVEHVENQFKRLYVAMTRPRDLLIMTSSGEPHPHIMDNQDLFKIVYW